MLSTINANNPDENVAVNEPPDRPFTHGHPGRRYLVAIDLGNDEEADLNDHIVAAAVAMAKPGDTVTLLSVLDDLAKLEGSDDMAFSYVGAEEANADVFEEIEDERHRDSEILEGYKAKFPESVHVITEVVLGDAERRIVEIAEAVGATAVVVGKRTLGTWKSFITHSTSSYVISHAQCNVMVVQLRS